MFLATLGFLHFHTNFKILCSSSLKSTTGILMGISLNRQIALHKMVGHCKNINFSNPWTWCTFPSACVVFSIFHQCLAVSQCISYVSLLLLFFSHSVESNSLWSHGLQHSRLPCPSPSPRVWSNSCPLSRWWYPNISSSVIPFSISQHQGFFQLVSSLHQMVKVLEFGISPSNDYSGLIYFRTDWFDILVVQGTLRSLLQPHSSKASILWCWSFFMFQLSIHDYWKKKKNHIAFTIWTFVGKLMSLIFNILPRFVIDFLPRSNFLLISWLQSPSAVILKHKEIVCHCFHCFPLYLPWSDGTVCHDLTFLNDEF